MNKKIILIGAGGHAKSCINLIKSSTKYNIIGLIEENTSKNILECEILGGKENLSYLKKRGIKYCGIAVGQIQSPKLRIRYYNFAKKIGFHIPKIISISSECSEYSKINEGTYVFDNTYIGPDASIGRNCIINTGSIIEHDSKVGDNCHISTGAILNGSVIIKKNTFIGSRVCIKQGVVIGENCVIGMGLVVKKDVPNNKILK
jgi:sugar O-acyltransferase (sialic acid O-acetyltransferase NeuD family)